MLSKRLLTIANMVDKNKVVFDVGSDHGLLPCFLLLNNISKKAYAADIKENPLKNAQENIKKYHLEDKVIPVLSNGLEKAGDDVDVVTISGMGFYTIKDILDNSFKDYEYYIVQPNSNLELFRQYLSDHHYEIIDEEIVYDGFYYEVIKFCKNYHDVYNKKEIKYGPILLKKKSPIFIDSLVFKKEKLESININANKDIYYEEIKEIEQILKELKG